MTIFIRTLIILVTFYLATTLNQLLPYYYSWDMDLITVLDLLIMSDGQMPAHMAHPGFGLYWLLNTSQNLAQYFGYITDVSMSSLFQSEQPFLLLAERMSFLRTMHVLFSLSASIFLWLAMRNLIGKSKVRDVLLLLLFLSLPGLWKYDYLMIRTEVYAVLAWSISLYFLTKTKFAEIQSKNTLFVLLCGFFAGISFITKVQVFFLVLTLPVLYHLLKEKTNYTNFSFSKSKAVLCVLFLTLLSVGSQNIYEPIHVKTFADYYSPNKFLYLTLLLILFIYITNRFNRFNQYNYFLKYFGLGFFICFIAPVSSFDSLKEGLRYSLLNYKIAFLRHTRFTNIDQFDFINILQVNITNYWIAFALFLTLILASLIYKKGSKLLLLALAILVLLQLGMGTRTSIQDSIWAQVTLISFTLFLVAKFHKFWQILVTLILITWNVHSVTNFQKFRITKGIAYYDSFIFFQEAYSIGFYEEQMLKRYTDTKSMNDAVKLADMLSLIQGYLANNIDYKQINLRDVTIIDSKVAIHLKDIRPLILAFYTGQT